MKCRGKPDTTVLYMNYSAEYHVFPATFHVISRKVDYLWDSVWDSELPYYPCSL